MSYYCFHCLNELSLDRGKCGRRDACPQCGTDLHACLNCLHYDRSAYNECRETQADRVLEKNHSNFCDFFSFKDLPQKPSRNEDSKSKFDKLDDLFKK